MANQQSISLMFVTESADDAQSLIAALKAFAANPVNQGAVLNNLSLEEVPGATKSEKIVAAVLVVSLNLGYGVVGNFLYDLLKDKPGVECVVGDRPLDAFAAKDPAVVEAAVREAAKPIPGIDGP